MRQPGNYRSSSRRFCFQRQRSNGRRPPPAHLPLVSLLFMPHQIIQIDELLRLVIDELIGTSPRAAVSFALTCRSLEGPTLSSLWKQQYSLPDLVKVLPSHTCSKDEHGVDSVVVSGHNFRTDRIKYQLTQAIEHDPSAEDWTRLRRYASWMRGLHLGSSGDITSDTLFRLSSNSPGGILFPKLETLIWDIHKASTALKFFRLFFSPNLGYVILYTYSILSDVPRSQLGALTQLISSLPTSLQDLSIACRWGSCEPLQETVSSFICRCGSLRTFGTCVPLSEAAIHHLTQIPTLRRWITIQGPPPTVPTFIFPSLESLRLEKPATLPWLHLLASHEEGTLRSGSSATSHPNTRETLTSLNCHGSITFDSLLLPSIAKFRNLAELCLDTYCYNTEGCAFRSTDHDMETLAAALPRLKTLQLGLPCPSGSCKTTVASLMSISVHCLDLTVLETHFNTRAIVGDMQRLLDGGAERSKEKCKLRNLAVGYLPLEVREEEVEAVAVGLKVIFPCLTECVDCNGCWFECNLELGVDGGIPYS